MRFTCSVNVNVSSSIDLVEEIIGFLQTMEQTEKKQSLTDQNEANVLCCRFIKE